MAKGTQIPADLQVVRGSNLDELRDAMFPKPGCEPVKVSFETADGRILEGPLLSCAPASKYGGPRGSYFLEVPKARDGMMYDPETGTGHIYDDD